MKQGPIIAVGLIVIVYVSLAVLFSQTLHFSRALDEGYHLELVSFIKQTGRLPITYEERAQMARADLPPLYHILVALVSNGVAITDRPYFKYYGDSFRYRVIDHQQEHPLTIDTEDMAPLYLGLFLVWQMGRWLSIILSVGTLLLVFITLQEIPVGRHPLTSLFGMALLAFIPRFIILSAALNDDSLLGLVAAIYFWLLVRLIKAPKRWWSLLGLGVALGVSVTIKYSLVLLPIELAIVLTVIARKHKFNWRWITARLVTVGTVALVCSSWWFGWNIWYFNTIATDGALVGLIRALLGGGYNATLNQIGGILAGEPLGTVPTIDGSSSDTFFAWVVSTFYSFWGYGIGDQVPLGMFGFSAVILLLIAAVLGLWRLWGNLPDTRQWILLAGFHGVLLLIVPLIRFETSGRVGQTAQGRHILIPAATAIIGLIVWGLAAIIARRYHKLIFSLIVAMFMGWSGLHLYQISASAIPLLPVRTVVQAAEWLPELANARFGDTIELASFDVYPEPKNGAVRLELAWRALGYNTENYLLQVEIVNNAGQVVSHWLGYNGQGRLPTLAWDPGDSVFDRLVLPLPNLPAGDYTVQIQLLGNVGPLLFTQRPDNGANKQVTQDISLLLTTISLAEPSTLILSEEFDNPSRDSNENENLESKTIVLDSNTLFSREMELVNNQSAGSLQVNYQLWRTGGAVEQASPPVYRYPGTITIITSHDDLLVELVDDQNQSWPATASEANIHTFVIGPRWQSGSYRMRLTVEQDGQTLSQTDSQPLLTVENWWKRRFELPAIAVPANANFADQINFLGYNLPQTQVKAGEALPLTLYWQAPANKSPQADFIQFNHLYDNSGILRGGYDRRPLEYYSTLLWAPGEIVVDGYAVPVEADAPPGEYYLDVGYYLTVGEAAVNLPLVVDEQMSQVSSVTIGPIEVVSP